MSPNRIALAHLNLDEKDEAFRWFARAYADRSLRPDFMKVDPSYDPTCGATAGFTS